SEEGRYGERGQGRDDPRVPWTLAPTTAPASRPSGDELAGRLGLRGRAVVEQRVVDGLDGARVALRVEATAGELVRGTAHRAPLLRIDDEVADRVGERLRVLPRHEHSRLARHEHLGASDRPGRDDRPRVRGRLDHGSAEADLLVREDDEVERPVDLARLDRERDEVEVLR